MVPGAVVVVVLISALTGGTGKRSSDGVPPSLSRKHGLPCDMFSDSPVNLNATIAVMTAAVPPYALCTRNKNLVDTFVRVHGKWRDCDVLPRLLDLAAETKPRRVFVDVGANIGACSMLMAARGGIRVVSFEPEPDNYYALKAAMVANDFGPGVDMRLVNAGASDASATANIYVDRINSGNSIVRMQGEPAPTQPALGSNGKGFVPRGTSSQIALTTLDEEIHEHVHLLKLDCQGCELHALRGARMLMRTHGIDIIKFEFAPHFVQAFAGGDGTSAEQLLYLLMDTDYTLYRCGREKGRLHRNQVRPLIEHLVGDTRLEQKDNVRHLSRNGRGALYTDLYAVHARLALSEMNVCRRW